MAQVSQEQIASLQECIRQYKHEISWIDTMLTYRGLDGKTRNIGVERRKKTAIKLSNLEAILKVVESL